MRERVATLPPWFLRLYLNLRHWKDENMMIITRCENFNEGLKLGTHMWYGIECQLRIEDSITNKWKRKPTNWKNMLTRPIVREVISNRPEQHRNSTSESHNYWLQNMFPHWYLVSIWVFFSCNYSSLREWYFCSQTKEHCSQTDCHLRPRYNGLQVVLLFLQPLYLYVHLPFSQYHRIIIMLATPCSRLGYSI